MNSRAKKSLGQHFLKNRAAVETIIDALDISGGDTIIEIGPGAGALTLPLLQRSNGNHITKPWLNSVIGPSPKEKECGIRSIEYDSKNKKCDAHESCLLNSESIRVIAIEKDERLAKRLQSTVRDAFPSDSEFMRPDLEVVTGDALKILPTIVRDSGFRTQDSRNEERGVPESCFLNHESSYKIAGNIPYYITGRLLRVISELEHKPEFTVLTIQKEVAERICAKPPKMNLLAAITQFWATPKILMRLTPADFSPPPKVHSAILELKTHPSFLTAHSSPLVAQHSLFARALFRHPRKTILNNLKSADFLSEYDILSLMGRSFLSKRPHDLSMEQITTVVSLLTQNQK